MQYGGPLVGGVVVAWARVRRTGEVCLEEAPPEFLVMIVWRLIGMNLRCKDF